MIAAHSATPSQTTDAASLATPREAGTTSMATTEAAESQAALSDAGTLKAAKARAARAFLAGSGPEAFPAAKSLTTPQAMQQKAATMKRRANHIPTRVPGMKENCQRSWKAHFGVFFW